MAGPFVYSSEQLGEDQIRALEIQPGCGDDALHCKLTTIERSAGTAYKALSYAWGDPARDYLIYVEGMNFYIHQSLFEALYQIRHETRIVRLWTDAICINQDDVSERNVQVERMGRTYAEAEEVLIWLGPAAADSQILYDFCDFISCHGRLPVAALQRIWPFVCAVLSLPWFVRLWTFQEALLAREGTLLLGTQSCSLVTLTEWTKLDVFHIGVLLVQLYDSVDHLLEAMALLQPGLKALTTLSRTLKIGLSGRTWPGLLHNTAYRLCSDSRDHIFGVVGVAKSIGIEHETVDYSTTTEEVFMQASKNILIRDLNHLIWLQPGYRDDAQSLYTLPSWAIDFSRNLTVGPFMPSRYHAGGPQEEFKLDTGSFSTEFDSLKLKGYAFDTVIRHVECWDAKPLNGGRVVELEKQFVDQHITFNPYGDCNDLLQAFWRTLVANVAGRNSDLSGIRRTEIPWPSTDHGAAYEVFVHRAKPMASCGHEANSNTAYLSFKRQFSISIRVCAGRHVFSTKSGYLGLGAGSLKLGDEVIIVPGLEMPLMIRRAHGACQYRLIGPCYVHGIMHGEFVRQMKREGKSGELREFELI